MGISTVISTGEGKAIAWARGVELGNAGPGSHEPILILRAIWRVLGGAIGWLVGLGMSWG